MLSGRAAGRHDGRVTPLLASSLTTFIDQHSQWALLLMFALLTLESFGLPVPGETALIACSVLASQGTFSIAWVVVIGVAAAIIGDNLGYWAARKGGRPLLQRHRWTRTYAEKYLPRGERFFAKHGGKAVFLGRFVAVLRVTSAWIAGISHMPWWRFLGWNAAGGIVWATTVSLVSYWLGDAAAAAFSRYGLYAAGGAILLSALGFLVVRRLEKRVLQEDD
jgi:membrane-associated protein